MQGDKRPIEISVCIVALLSVKHVIMDPFSKAIRWGGGHNEAIEFKQKAGIKAGANLRF